VTGKDAAEESVDPKRDMPKGIMLGMFTLMVSAFCVLFLNPSVIGVGSFKLGTSGEPLLDGFRAIYGEGFASALALVAVTGLVASFHAIIFAYGRQIYSLSRAGYFPRALSMTHGTRKTPHIAMVVGALLGLAVMLTVWFVEGADQGAEVIGGTLLNMAVFGATFSYVMQGLTYIQLKRKFPHIARPYKSPLGNVGAALTVIIALATIYMQLHDPVCRRRLVGGGLVCGGHLLRACWPPQAHPVAGGGVCHGARRSGV
jgi:ethanolamine permease